jgi:hypothetical protein
MAYSLSMALQLTSEQRFQALLSITVPLLTHNVIDNPVSLARQAEEYLQALIDQAGNPVPLNPANPL